MNLLSLAEAARRLGVSRTRVRQFVDEGRLATAPGDTGKVTVAEVARFAAIPRRNGRPQGATDVVPSSAPTIGSSRPDALAVPS